MAEKIYIFDTTLRDGEQSAGCAMTIDEKLKVAHALGALRVDVIEAGFPIASPGDFEAVKRIASEVKGPKIAGLARARREDIEAAAEALRPAGERARIHTFIATSPIHMERKLRMTPEEVLSRAREAVKLARSLAPEVEFSPEDAGRSEMDFLCRVIEAAIDAGARVINIPDTVGYTTPSEFGARIREIMERVPNSDKAIFSVHCHNDLGLAVANSLAAIEAGARQIECTINGIGERAGNAALEEIVMILKTRRDRYPFEVGVDTTKLVPTSRLVSQITGIPVQPNKAIVGANAFAHASGIHQDGVLKHAQTYEIMTPESVGWTTSRIVLSKHSGRAALRARLRELGVEVDEARLNELFRRFKELADKKKEVYDEDLLALVAEGETAPSERIRLVSLHVASGTHDKPVAAVELEIDGAKHSATSEGDGPVDATFRAIHALVEPRAKLKLYQVSSITSGTDAQGEVLVQLEGEDGRTVVGRGADTDIIVASAKALIAALNRLPAARARGPHPQHSPI